MKLRKSHIPVAISITAISAAILRVLFPQLSLDATTALLLAVAAIPWLGHFFKSVELPGGLKIEYKDIQEIDTAAKAAGLLPGPEQQTNAQEPLFVRVAAEDANLAMAGLRLELEKELAALAQRRNVEIEGATLGALNKLLAEKQIISAGAYLAISDLSRLLNTAVHGAKVDPAALQWALKQGPQILSAIRNANAQAT